MYLVKFLCTGFKLRVKDVYVLIITFLINLVSMRVQFKYIMNKLDHLL